MLHVDIDGGSVSRPVPTLAGDYRLFYAGIRDALLGKAPAARHRCGRLARGAVLEWAAESSDERREIVCDWSDEPE